MGSYSHTQRGWIHWMCHAFSLGFLLVAFTVQNIEPVFIPMLIGGLLCALVGLSFESLTVTDAGSRLDVAFGPLPVFRTSVSYCDIVVVTAGRTTFLDGWGVHWVPGRGWIYNIHGWDCVEIRKTNSRTLRIGTDEPEALVAVIQDHLRHLEGRSVDQH